MLRKNMPPLLLAAALLLTGCAPEEKTLLLPQASLAEEESEESDAARDYTVKKIYTYSYETRPDLFKSAFLEGCGENEIHIISQVEEAPNSSEVDTQLDGAQGPQEAVGRKLEYRQVDYRYGFYDSVGDFLWTWEQWNNPEGGEMESDLFIHSLLPSPDGRQLLVDIRSAFWDTVFVWLYTLGTEEPLLLYEGEGGTEGPLKGSFSQDGRFVTFDVFGASTGFNNLVPVYDSQKQRPAQAPESWIIPANSGRLYPPDYMLCNDIRSWDATLADHGGRPALVSIRRENDGKNQLLAATRIALPEDQDTAPDPSVLEQSEAPAYQYNSTYLPGSAYLPDKDEWTDRARLPYPLYRLSENGGCIHYALDPYNLWNMDFDNFEPIGKPVTFPGILWDFLPLDSGAVLAALAQDAGSVPSANLRMQSQTTNRLPMPGLCAAVTGSAGNPFSVLILLDQTEKQNMEEEEHYNYWTENLPMAIQDTWEIRSADLYLYPAWDAEGRLLYKNLQNLLNMEYDEATGRILLETYEGNDLSRRRCIILEM